MPFGLRNAGQTFQRYIFRALGVLDLAFAYFDDILIASSTMEEHENHLKIVFQRLKNFSLRINVDKCVLGVNKIELLGYLVDSQGIKPTQDKLKAIADFPEPRTVNELRRFLGNFYRRNTPHAAQIQFSLYIYLRD